MLTKFYGRILNVNAAIMATIDSMLAIFVSLSLVAFSTRLGMPNIGMAFAGLILMLITITHSQTFWTSLVPLLKGLEAHEVKYDSEVEKHMQTIRGVIRWSVFAVICKAVFVVIVVTCVYLWKFKYITLEHVYVMYLLGYIPSLLGGWIAKTVAQNGAKKVY